MVSAICGCGRDAGQVDVQRDGATIVTGWMCDGCFTDALADMDVKRTQFEALIAAGVPRDKANEIMIARMNGAQTS